MSFYDGDRVIVTRFESPYSVDLTGFYGHVAGHYDVQAGLVPVVLMGCIDAAPDRDELETIIESCRQKPFPLREDELQHAD